MARPAPAVNRAIRLLDLLVAHPTERFTLSELVRRTGVSLGSAHAVLAVLEDVGYVSRHRDHKTYALGPALVAAGLASLTAQPAVQVAVDGLDRLAADIDAEVVVTAATDAEIIFVARAGTPSPHGPQVRIGERVPLAPPLGAVFLAWAAEPDVAAWAARSPVGGPDAEQLHAMLDHVRTHGYSIGAGSAVQRAFGAALAGLAEEPQQQALRAEIPGLLRALVEGGYEVAAVQEQASYDVGTIAAPVFDAAGQATVAVTGIGFPPGLSGSQVLERAEAVRDFGIVATKTAHGRLPETD